MADEERTRDEVLLADVAEGSEITDIRTWKEKLLADAAAGEETRPDARERLDLFINAITGGSGGGGGYKLDVYDEYTLDTLFTGDMSDILLNIVSGFSDLSVMAFISADCSDIDYPGTLPGIIIPEPTVNAAVVAFGKFGLVSGDVFRWADGAPIAFYVYGMEPVVDDGTLGQFWVDMENQLDLAEYVSCTLYVLTLEE